MPRRVPSRHALPVEVIVNVNRRQLTLLAGAAALGVAAPRAKAQDKPLDEDPRSASRPAGRCRRRRAAAGRQHEERSLDQNVIVDNKPGAAGRVALGELKRAAPDGNSAGARAERRARHPAVAVQERRLRPGARLHADRPRHDLRFRRSPPARPRRPATSRRCSPGSKANPDKANYATSGAGTVPHFTGVLLGQETGIPLTHVAYKGGALAAQDLLRRAGADDDRHRLRDDRAPSRRQAADPGHHRRQPLGARAARGADAEGGWASTSSPTRSSALYGPAGHARAGPRPEDQRRRREDARQSRHPGHASAPSR